MKSKQLKNKRSHLPEEGTLHNHYRRVAGAFKYMSNYMQNKPTKLDWKQYGYQKHNLLQQSSLRMTSIQFDNKLVLELLAIPGMKEITALSGYWTIV